VVKRSTTDLRAAAPAAPARVRTGTARESREYAGAVDVGGDIDWGEGNEEGNDDDDDDEEEEESEGDFFIRLRSAAQRRETAP